MPVTRTLGPLHFEDLEPKRFEDLVRQIVYDFKTWRRLEATGRGGSDDGFDARGFEILQGVSERDPEDDEEELVLHQDRLWLIQCKRERTITPKMLSAYLDDIRLAPGESLHGIVFAAACDFSKRSHDVFRKRCESLGIQEWSLWGKAELEDLLFQPRNDALLFAYFGISLAIRRRTQKSELRAKLAMKRKAHRTLEDKLHRSVLLRSPDAEQYPNSNEVANFKTQPPWVLRDYRGMVHEGLLFLVYRHFAYLDDGCTGWDAAMAQNDSRSPDDPWNRERNNGQLRSEILEAWSNFPKQNQAWLEVYGVVPFESILEIDEIGDDIIEAPHIYVQFNGQRGPFTGFRAVVEPAYQYTGRSLFPNDEEDCRLSIFKSEWRTKPREGTSDNTATGA